MMPTFQAGERFQHVRKGGCGPLRKGIADPSAEDSIVLMEVVPVVVATAVWGCLWKGKLVKFHVDNTAAARALIADQSLSCSC